MALIDRILIPIDFSDDTAETLQFAEKIASACNSIVDLLHVIPNTILRDEWMREAADIENREKDTQNIGQELYPLIFKEADDKLSTLHEKYFLHINRGETYLKVDRSPAHAIADHAWNGNYSMVVMSAKGKDKSGWFRGSTTEDVIRSSKVPVLSVYKGAKSVEDGNIIIPVDGSLLSMSATPAAALLASVFNATVTYLYIHEVLGLFSKTVPDKPDDIQSRKSAEYLMDQLMEFLDTAKPHGLHVIDSEMTGLTALVIDNREIGISFEVISGYSAHHEITSFAHQYADMVVMATHGRSGLAHMLLGSHAEKVALNTEKTVLTFRPDSKLFKQQNT